MRSFFGTDGFRGEANVFLTAEHAFRLGCFLGEYCRGRAGAGETCRAVIGKDPRRSSYMFEYALAAGADGVRDGRLSVARHHHAVGELHRPRGGL